MEHFGKLPRSVHPFTHEEVERARRYHRPLYALRLAGLGVGLVVPGFLAFAARPSFDSFWPVQTVALTVFVLFAEAFILFPAAAWRQRRERKWGFSTQTPGAWLLDQAKAFAIGAVIASGWMLGLVGSARAFPAWWPLVVAAGGALLVLVMRFIAPVVLEPVFNRFRPLGDQDLAGDLRALADRAGVPVRDVLVADASRRTRKHNAYVSGLGRTRRVVVWDTLLEAMPPAGLRIVVAHELAHRRFRHVAWGTALEMAGTVAYVVMLWASLQWNDLRTAIGVDGARDPEIVPFALFLGAALGLVAVPFRAALSRRFERAADRFSLALTGDPEGYEAMHRDLATANVSDLDPPRAYYLVFHTHPTAPERLAAGRTWSRKRADQDPV